MALVPEPGSELLREGCGVRCNVVGTNLITVIQRKVATNAAAQLLQVKTNLATLTSFADLRAADASLLLLNMVIHETKPLHPTIRDVVTNENHGSY